MGDFKAPGDLNVPPGLMTSALRNVSQHHSHLPTILMIFFPIFTPCVFV